MCNCEPEIPRSGDVHGPLINRIIDGEIRSWLDTQLGLCEASEPTSDGVKALQRARSIHLGYPDTEVTPRIVYALRLAGLLSLGKCEHDS